MRTITMRTITRSLTALVLAALTAALIPSAAHADANANRGAAWLVRHSPVSGDGAAADTLLALRATGRLTAGEARRRVTALRRGAPRYATTAGATAKVILGLAAGGVGNPRCVNRLDLLRRLQGYGRRGRYGTTIFDHTLGMLAMSALRAGPPASTVRTLLAARGSGGWNFNMTARGGRRDDVTSTAMAILAARAAGVSARNRTLRAGLAWLRSQRAPTGGFAEGRRDRTEANPTALAIQAQRAMGIRDGRAIRALRTLQQGDGSFRFTRTESGSRLLATIDAVTALSGKRLPVVQVRRRPGGCR